MFKKLGILFIILISMELNAKNYNLAHAQYQIMERFKAEAFLAERIYTAKEGTKEYYSLNEYAYLLEYVSDEQTGLNAGLYLLKNDAKDYSQRYVIAFGGTTASDTSESDDMQTIDKLGDVITDLNLLNNREKVVIQPKQAKVFTEYFIRMHELNKKDITLTGHSLAGGLVQYVSHSLGIKGVTFNTAPYPIYDRISFNNYISNPKVDVINIMSSEDELTGTLLYLEDLEKCFTNIGTHRGEMFTTMTDKIRDAISNLRYKGYDVFPDEEIEKVGIAIGSKLLAIVSTRVVSLKVKKRLLYNWQNNNWYKLSKDVKAISNTFKDDKDYLEAEKNYNKALTALMNKNIPAFIYNMKLAWKIENISLQKLFMGKRVVLPTETHHSVLDLIKKSYKDYSNTQKEWDEYKKSTNTLYSKRQEELKVYVAGFGFKDKDRVDKCVTVGAFYKALTNIKPSNYIEELQKYTNKSGNMNISIETALYFLDKYSQAYFTNNYANGIVYSKSIVNPWGDYNKKEKYKKRFKLYKKLNLAPEIRRQFITMQGASIGLNSMQMKNLHLCLTGYKAINFLYNYKNTIDEYIKEK